MNLNIIFVDNFQPICSEFEESTVDWRVSDQTNPIRCVHVFGFREIRQSHTTDLCLFLISFKACIFRLAKFSCSMRLIRQTFSQSESLAIGNAWIETSDSVS